MDEAMQRHRWHDVNKETSASNQRNRKYTDKRPTS